MAKYVMALDAGTTSNWFSFSMKGRSLQRCTEGTQYFPNRAG